MEEMERIVAMILILRRYPEIFHRACLALGRRSAVVTIHGLPVVGEELRSCRRKCQGVAYDRAGLHREIDREISIESRWIKGFLTYLTSQKRLYEVIPSLMDEHRERR